MHLDMENTMIYGLNFKNNSNSLKTIVLCEGNLTDPVLFSIATHCPELQFLELRGKDAEFKF